MTTLRRIAAVATGALRFREVVIASDIPASMKEDFEEARQALLGFLDGMWRGGAPFHAADGGLRRGHPRPAPRAGR